MALAEARDLEAVQAFEINLVSSSPKAMARYRDLCVIAISTRAGLGVTREFSAGDLYVYDFGLCSYEKV